MYGYAGQVLIVNLSMGTTQVERPEPAFYRRYVGGRNIGAYYLLQGTKPRCDPLGPENRLIFASSVLTGAPISGQSRVSAVAKSPLTGGWGEAEAGGWWGPELKAAGFDAVVLDGAAPEPTYLYIHDNVVELRAARHLVGLPTKEAQQAIQSELCDAKIRVAQIGPAGERLVPYACITNDLSHFYGRCGLGAVMGSKNLRAIAVRGSGKPTVSDPEALRTLATWFNRAIKSHPALSLHTRLGTAKGVLGVNAAGLLPTENFQRGTFAGAEGISGEAMEARILRSNDSCFACAVRCKRVVASDGKYKIDPAYGGPEYETIGLFGASCGIDDIEVVAKANELCNANGLDTISTAGTIAFAMECFERGLLTAADTEGLELRFGRADAMLRTVELIARREGIGVLLSTGSRRAAEKIGHGAEKYALTVKGQELPAHEPRGKWGVALGYAVSPTGADHLNAAHDPWFERENDPDTSWISLHDIMPLGIIEPVSATYLGPEKVAMFVALQNIWSLINVLDYCLFTVVPEFSIYRLDQLVEIVRAVSGWNTSLEEMVLWGERGINLARAYNVREGLGPEADTVPERLFEPLPDGPFRGIGIPREDLARAVRLYYGMRGWDAEGRPSAAKLHQLGLGWVIEAL